MNYVGIDIHKRYSVLAAQDEEGRKLKEARIEGNGAEDYARFFQRLEGPSKAVLEACWNWGLTHDLLLGGMGSHWASPDSSDSW